MRFTITSKSDHLDSAGAVLGDGRGGTFGGSHGAFYYEGRYFDQIKLPSRRGGHGGLEVGR
jgi:hypothetical protein